VYEIWSKEVCHLA